MVTGLYLALLLLVAPLARADAGVPGATTAPATAAPASGPSSAPESRPVTAGEWFAAGSAKHRAGDLGGAVEAYKKAYHLEPHSIHLFNIALALRQMARYAESLRYYELFLGAEPDSALRAEVEGRIAELKELVKEAEAVRRLMPISPESAAALTAPAPRRTALVVGLIAGGAAATAIAVSVSIAVAFSRSPDQRLIARFERDGAVIFDSR